MSGNIIERVDGPDGYTVTEEINEAGHIIRTKRDSLGRPTYINTTIPRKVPPTDIADSLIIYLAKVYVPEQVKDIFKAVSAHTLSWVGETKYRVICMVPTGLPAEHAHIKLHIGSDDGKTYAPLDTDQMDSILVDIPEISRVKFVRQFDLLDYKKPKPQTRTKPYKSTSIEDLPPGDPKYDFLNCEAAFDEMKKLKALLTGYPFDTLSPDENKRFIYDKVINSMRVDWPFLYELDRIIGGKFTDAYRLLAEPDNHRKLGEHWLSVARFYHPIRQTYMYEQIASHIKNDIFIFNWLEEKKAREQKHGGRRAGYRMVTEDDSGDRYLEQASASVGRVQYDPSLDDDTRRAPTKIVVKNKYAR